MRGNVNFVKSKGNVTGHDNQVIVGVSQASGVANENLRGCEAKAEKSMENNIDRITCQLQEFQESARRKLSFDVRDGISKILDSPFGSRKERLLVDFGELDAVGLVVHVRSFGR
jgi:hypothetical protein